MIEECGLSGMAPLHAIGSVAANAVIPFAGSMPVSLRRPLRAQNGGMATSRRPRFRRSEFVVVRRIFRDWNPAGISSPFNIPGHVGTRIGLKASASLRAPSKTALRLGSSPHEHFPNPDSRA